METTESTTGIVSVLNVYEGDVKLSFNVQDPAERIRASRIITDMLHRGYALLVQLEDGSYQRVLNFDETKGEYVIADFDPSYRRGRGEGDGEQREMKDGEEEDEKKAPPQQTMRRGRGRRRLNMATTNAVAIARSAGG